MNAAISTRFRWMVVVLAAAVISRVPFLFGGYGADPDAWRVAYVAKKLWTSGVYEVSRFPGYPLHEFVSVLPIAVGGSLLSNAATLLCALGAIVIWSRIAQAHARHPWLLVLAFAFAPIFWVNSATTMDYVWSLLFILLSYNEALAGRSIRSGLAMGIAVGFRPSNVVVAGAMVVVLLLRRDRWRSLTRFGVAAGGSTLTSFLPVVLTYGLAGWLQHTREQINTINETAAMHVLLFGYRMVYAIGPLAAIAVLLVLLRSSRSVRERCRKGDPILVSSIVGIGTILLLFFILPLERDYLLPAVPFFLLLIDAVASRRAMIAIVLYLWSFAFLSPDVIRHAGLHGRPGFNLQPGMVIEEGLQKRALLARRAFLSAYPFKENTVVMTGAGPVFWLENPMVEPLQGQDRNDVRDVVVRSITNENVLFTPMLRKSELDSIRTSGYVVLCVSDLREYIEKSMGYTMKGEGIGLVSVPRF